MISNSVLMICEGATVTCAKRRDAHCFVQFLLEQTLAPAFNTCTKKLREGRDFAKTLLLPRMLDIHQSKPLRVDLKESRELEHLRKINGIR